MVRCPICGSEVIVVQNSNDTEYSKRWPYVAKCSKEGWHHGEIGETEEKALAHFDNIWANREIARLTALVDDLTLNQVEKLPF